MGGGAWALLNDWHFSPSEVRMQEMLSMGIGNKPFLDIKPSEAAIHDRAINYIMKGRGGSLPNVLLPCPLAAQGCTGLHDEFLSLRQAPGPGLPSRCLSLTTPTLTRDLQPLCPLAAHPPAQGLGLSTYTCTWIRPCCLQCCPPTFL